MKIATFEKEKELLGIGYHIIIGIDEVGRGPLAGPVVTAACVVKDVACFTCDDTIEKEWRYVRDSKLLSEKKREEIYDFIQKHFYVGIGMSMPDTIDRINILQATFLAMKKAVTDLEKILDHSGAYLNAEKMIVLIDGNQRIPNFTREQMCIAKGDQKIRSISAASIIAKVTRDTMMKKYDNQYPDYGFRGHKGYGTKIHMEALQKYGATPIHRRSFAPVKNVL